MSNAAPKPKEVPAYAKQFINKGIEFGETMALLNSLEAIRAGTMLVTARDLLTRAQIGYKIAKANPEEKARFERWFGTFDETRYKTVTANLTKVANYLCAPKIMLHYRGKKADGQKCDAEYEMDGVKSVKNGIFTWPKGNEGTFAFVYPGEEYKPVAHVYICDAFFTVPCHKKIKPADWMKMAPEGKGYDCPAGTLIHELTHTLCDTDDEDLPSGQKGYGTAAGIWFGKNQPATAIKNADNYEYYCESFWLVLDTKLKEVVDKDGQLEMTK